MNEGATKEVETNPEFPPQEGELRIRRLWQKGLRDDPEEYGLLEESLRYYYKVGETGEHWMYGELAKIPKGLDQNVEPSDEVGVDVATQSTVVDLSSTLRVEHQKASDADLKRYTESLLDSFQNEPRTLWQFTEHVEQAAGLQATEKDRFVNILRCG